MASTPGGCLYGSVDESSGSELREVDSTSSGATTRVRPHRERTGEDDEVFWNRGYLLFKKGQASTWRAAAVKAVLVTAIVASLGTILAETIPTSDNARRDAVILRVEQVVVAIFAIEIVVRVACCTVDPSLADIRVFGWTLYKAPLSLEVHPVWGRVAFLLRPLTLADVVAFVPAVVALAQRKLTGPWMLLRVFRLFRFYRHSRLLGALTELAHVIHQRAGMLMATVVLDASLLLVPGSLMYYVEADHPDTMFVSNILFTTHNPDPPNVQSGTPSLAPRFRPFFPSPLPEGLWYGTATLSTVGYGDVTPITWPGKLIGGAAAVLAVGLFGLPAGILSDGFKEMAEQRRARLAWMERVVAAFQRKYAKRVAMKRWFLHVLRDRCQREWVLYSDGDEDVVEWHPYSRHGTAHGGPKAPKMGARMPAAKPFVIATGVRDVPIVLRPFDAPSERSVRLTERRIAQRRGPGHSDHDHDRDHNHRNHHDHRGHARHRDHPFDENGRDESGEPASSTGASEGELSSQPALERSAIGRKHRPRQPTGHGVRREMSVPSTCCGATMRVQVVVTMGEGGDAGVASPHSSGGENAGPPPSSEGENAGPSRSSEEAPLRRGVAIDSRSSRGDPDDERPARAVADLPFGISEEDVLQYAARGAGGAITP